MNSDELRLARFPSVEEFLSSHDLDPALRAPLAEMLERSSLDVAGALKGGVAMAGDPSDARLVWTRHVALGGMGEIHRVYDRTLHRTLIMKVLRDRFVKDPAMHAVFLKEAQFTAQLAHPSIPPVHEIGTLDDGRPFFTMKEVHGRTLSAILKHVHSTQTRPGPTGESSVEVSSRPVPVVNSELVTAPTQVSRVPAASEQRGPEVEEPFGDWNDHRLLEVFQKVCEAVAYAHSRGVVHCDLKPDNVMVGQFGEVVVMDWGVALLAAETADATAQPVETRGFDRDAALMVGGTPGYMAPEQMAAAIESVGAFTDVYALGVILYQLFAGKRPYRGKRGRLFQLAMKGEVPPLPAREETVADEAIFDIIVRAMRPNPTERIPGGAELAEEIALWREGALKREQALKFVASAQALLPEIGARREHANRLRQEVDELAAQQDLTDKTEMWKLEDRLHELYREAALQAVEATHLLRDALVHAPALAEARQLLAHIHFDEHKLAEQRRDWQQAARHELLLRAHDDGEYADYLSASEWLRVTFERSCRVRLYRYRERKRRLVPEIIRAFANTEHIEFELPVGSYVLMLRPNSGPLVYYPFLLERRKPWDPAAERSDSEAVSVPGEDELLDDEVLVAAGRFRLGTQWHWLDDFVMKRTPVSALELAQFLRSSLGRPWRSAVLREGLTLWRPAWPAVGASFDAALAFAAWRSEQTGRKWRLPSELEWSKAAAGTDGRLYPWGDRGDESFCLCRSAHRSPSFPVESECHGIDSSPYGILGFGGNVRDWCAASGDAIVAGGSFRLPLAAARVETRASLPRTQGHADVGFRLVRDHRSISRS